MRRSKEKEKHLPYFSLVEALQQKETCFLCFLELNSVEAYLSSLVYEHVNDPNVRKTLQKSMGFCNRHAKRLAKQGQAYSISILCLAIIQNFLEKWGKDESFRSFSIRYKKNWNLSECPVCKIQIDSRKRYLEVFVEWFSEPSFKEEFVKGSMICLPHAYMILALLTQKEAKKSFINIVTLKYEELKKDLLEFQRKHDWRFVHEPMGKEGNVWQRAIIAIAGAPGAF